MTTGPQTTARPQIRPEVLDGWKSGKALYPQIAARLYEWAKSKPAGTQLPDDKEFAGDLPFVTLSVTPWNSAKKLLIKHGVLTYQDGRHRVA